MAVNILGLRYFIHVYCRCLVDASSSKHACQEHTCIKFQICKKSYVLNCTSHLYFKIFIKRPPSTRMIKRFEIQKIIFNPDDSKYELWNLDSLHSFLTVFGGFFLLLIIIAFFHLIFFKELSKFSKKLSTKSENSKVGHGQLYGRLWQDRARLSKA